MKHRCRRTLWIALIAALSCLLALECAVNPATGQRQLSLIGEDQEIQIGRENDKSIVAELGAYEDTALQEYVAQIGRDLAAKSERPELSWSFRVVDDPVVNAFAVPGGFIYITRGILAHFNSEAELASVLGHEIGHVTARHSVNQMSKAQLFQFGLAGASVLAPERMGQFGQLAQVGLGLLFLKYGRDDERQADDLGLRYMTRAGYDPRPMGEVFDTLARVSQSESGGRVPSWLSTHPAPEDREARVQQQVAALTQNLASAKVEREGYLRRVEGLVYGDDPRQGYFRGSVFFHPQLRFRVEFPGGWELVNRRQAVFAVSPGKDAAIQLTLASEPSPAAALQSFLGKQGIQRTSPWTRNIHGRSAAGSGFAVATEQGTLEGVAVFVEHAGRVFELIGYGVQQRWSGYDDEVARAITSFDELTDRRAIEVSPQRIEVVRIDAPMTLETFAQRHGSSVPVATLALLNHLDPGARLATGRSYKVVRGGVAP